jgi:hypothetical protein
LALASSFALTGCNKSHSVKPADGTAVESVEGAKKLAAAADKVVSYDAVSLSLKDAEITSKFNGYSLNTNAAQKGYETYPLKVEESLSGLSLTLGAKGLTATKNTDFVAAAKLKSNLSLTAKHESPTAPVDFSYSGSGLEVGAYVANTNVYLDASNQAFMDLINKYVSSMVNTMTSGQANVSITYPPFKGVMTGLLAKLPAPLLSLP